MFLSVFSRALFATLLLILISACSLELKEKGSIYYRTDFTWEEAQAHMNSRTIYNEAKSSENNNLGLGLVMLLKDSSTKADHYNLGGCTGFLLDSKTLVTNAHCVPKKIREREISCVDRIKFAHGGSFRNYNCKSLVYAHSAYTKDDDVNIADLGGFYEPDIAILEIEAVHNVKYFSQATKEEGLNTAADNEELFISSVDPVDKSSKKVYEGSYSLNKIFKIADSEIVRNTYRYLKAQVGAYFIRGNSGSPVHDANYKVKAIGFAGHRTLDNEVIVVDFTCLEKTTLGWEWDDTCIPRGTYAK